MVRAALGVAGALLVLAIAVRLIAGGGDHEGEAVTTQASFVTRASALCQTALTARERISKTPAIADAAPPETANESSTVRLKLVGELGGLTPRPEQVANLGRLRAQLTRRSQLEAELVTLRGEEDPASTKRRASLQGERTSVTIVLQALSGALEIPVCGEV